MSNLHQESSIEHSSADRPVRSQKKQKGGNGPVGRLLEYAMESSLAALDRTRLEHRLADFDRLREHAGADFLRELRREADKKFSRFLSHATSRARTFSAVTGVWGLPGQLLDVPLFYVQAFKNAAEVALLYGFDPRTPEQRTLLLSLVRIGHLPSFELRKRAIENLFRHPNQQEHSVVGSVLMAFPVRLCVSRSAKLLPQSLKIFAPLLGGVINALNSRALMESILDSAQMVYRRKAEEFVESPTPDEVSDDDAVS